MTPNEPILPDMDAGFRGVNNRVHPSLIAPGYVAEATNRRFDRGTILNRWSIIRPQWGGLSGQIELSLVVTAGETVLGGSIPKTPYSLASIHADGLPFGAKILSITEAGLTIDNNIETIDSTLHTLDETTTISISAKAISSTGSTLAYAADNSAPFAGNLIGIGRFSDPDYGDVVLVATDEMRDDGGRGRVWALQPSYPPQEVPLNGHDLAGRVRFLQCFNGVMMLRAGLGHWYFTGADVTANEITLAVIPPFDTGTRVTFLQLGEGTLGAAITRTNYYARVNGAVVTLHPSRADAVADRDTIDLTPSDSSAGFSLVRNDPNDVLDNPARNNAMPLIMQGNSSDREALEVGFDDVPIFLDVTSADPMTDALEVDNHRLIDGDPVAVTNSTVGGVPGGTYYASVVDPAHIRLYAVQLDALARNTSYIDITAAGDMSLRKSGAAGAPCPPARDGVYVGNRAWLVYGDDFMVASDVLDPIHYHRVSSEFRANSGSSDRIVTVAPFNRDTIIILKERSVLALTGVTGDLTNLALTEITRDYGCLAADSVAGTGSDLIWLSQRGVVTLRQTAEGITQSETTPLSEEIQGYVNQIAWRGVGEACGVYHSNRYLLSVPTESDPYRNGMTLAYNFQNRAWEGKWEGDMLNPVRYLPISVSGKPTLAFIDVSKRLHLFSESAGICDQCANGEQVPIETMLRTRGYRSQAFGTKRFIRMDLELASYAPTYSLNTIWDGVQERQQLVLDRTRDRSAYVTHGAGYYDPTNAGDDFWNAYRADYSFVPGLKCGTRGVGCDQRQRFTQHLDIGRRSGSALQLELTTSTGEVELIMAQQEAILHSTTGSQEY
jgi:hypothetical protein